MKRRALATLFAGLFALALGTASVTAEAAAPADVDAAVAAVEARYASIESLTANFEQRSISVAMGTEDVQVGNLAVKRPKNMRWEFTAPDAALMVSDGDQMWVHSVATNQVIQYSVQGATSGPESLLTDLASVREQFNVELITADAPLAGHFALRLTPKTPQSYKSVTLELHEESVLVGRITIVDSFDNETILTLSDVVMNGSVSDSLFVFEVPAGAEVIRADAM